MNQRNWIRALIAATVLSPTLAAAADLTVSAAASLTNAFNEIGKAYEQAQPGTRVLFNYGSSGALLQQIARGAPVDVFATADLETMDRAQKQSLIANDTRSDFVSNKLVLVVPSDSKLQLSTLADLARPEIQRIGVCPPESVPVGRYAREALELAGYQWDALQAKYIFGQNVRQVLDYVARGEVDAGFVYVTDAALMRDRVKVALEPEVKKPILYPIAVVKGGGNEKAARSFLKFVQSEAGQKILAKYGFAKP
jgi:molybdate transport system substrate-binding protein